MIDISLVEEMVFNPPKGIEGWRCYRIEYGGHAQACLVEGRIWLPSRADPDSIEQLLLGMQE